MIFGFDIISDLSLVKDDAFDWEGNQTSLFCVIAGNVTSDIYTLHKTLRHLSKLYQGVFFIDGALEHPDLENKDDVIDKIGRLSSTLNNVVYLHNNVVVVDGIALVGINGWYKNYSDDTADEFQLKCNFFDDLSYLEKTVERLQLHNDVKKIIVISNCVPSNSLYFGEDVGTLDNTTLDYILYKDTEKKISHWVFGTHKKIVDTTINDINYVNNPKHDRAPYYAKRIEIDL